MTMLLALAFRISALASGPSSSTGTYSDPSSRASAILESVCDTLLPPQPTVIVPWHCLSIRSRLSFEKRTAPPSWAIAPLSDMIL